MLNHSHSSKASPSLAEIRFVRLREVEQLVGLKKSMIYKMMALGKFPRQYKLCAQVSVWRLQEILAWMESACRG